MDLAAALRSMRAATHSEEVEWLREIVTERLTEVAAGPVRPLDRASLQYLHDLLDISQHHLWPVERDVPFVVAILQALSRAGTRASLRAVGPLTACDCLPVRSAAIACAAAICSRTSSQGTEKLLRVAEPVDLLLRRAAGSPPHLLRSPEEEA